MTNKFLDLLIFLAFLLVYIYEVNKNIGNKSTCKL